MTKEARIYIGAKTASSTNVPGKYGQATCKTMKLDHFFLHLHENKLKWIKVLNVRPQITKILEENMCSNLFHINHRNIFLDMSPLAGKQSTVKLLRLHQNEKFLHSGGNHRHNKRQPTKWEKVFANDTSDKGLILKICKNLCNSTIQSLNPSVSVVIIF